MLGPSPSAWPTCEFPVVAVQSPQVLAVSSIPAALLPVRMSCWIGVGDPAHYPLMRLRCSSMNSTGSPLRACSASLSAASIIPSEL